MVFILEQIHNMRDLFLFIVFVVLHVAHIHLIYLIILLLIFSQLTRRLSNVAADSELAYAKQISLSIRKTGYCSGYI